MEIGNLAIRKFGKRIRELRLQRRWSQDELAFELQVDRSYISGIERGQRNPTLRTIAKLAKIFNLSISELCQKV